ncbi:MAG: RpiB/LacA/LacB family sugar-phosphate isomerase [Flavobacteriales bacterium]|nr:RpiB/LacA/LacB family sugar-phosphate isomerase [Flavobacteriales bacterium]MCB9167073.1 RpiB/LacA/LacB family sugar-phosphate isomerase [Flavobacteriales bacterium]
MGLHEGARISIGTDHAGRDLKDLLSRHLSKLGYLVIDHGTSVPGSVDYPDMAHPVAADVAEGRSDMGVVICGSGNGVNMVANKHSGVRSALAWRPDVAALAREHNAANVLALPARFIDGDEAIAILDAFLKANFEGGRHERRVAKIERLSHSLP